MSPCTSCLQPKAPFECIHCLASVCKACVQFVDESSFPYFSLFEKKIKFGSQCPACFDSQSKDWVESYNAVYEKAKTIDVYYRRVHGKDTRLMKRIEPVLQVADCADEEDVLMKLAFCAVQRGATAVIDIEVFSQKSKEGSYTLVSWRGSGVAATR